MITQDNKAIIENWSVCDGPGENPYTAPELRKQHIGGKVYNHPRWNRDPDGHLADGHNIVTSPIKEVLGNGKEIITESGTHYTLGTPDPAYIKWVKETFPDQFKGWDEASMFVREVPTEETIPMSQRLSTPQDSPIGN